MYATFVHVHGSQKKVPDALELELLVSLSHPTWVLGTKV